MPTGAVAGEGAGPVPAAPGAPGPGGIGARAGRAAALLALLALVVLFWDWRVVEPLKLLVVFFHEASHALVARLTGGRVHELVVTVGQGGHVLSSGGNRFLTLNAGYLGSLLWGAFIYGAAARSRVDQLVMGALGLAVGAITVLFASGVFSWVFGAATALAMLLAATFLPAAANDFLLRLVGLTSMVYVPRDIVSDTLARSHLRSDARMLAEEYGGATVLWGGLWLVLSVAVIAACLVTSVRDGDD